MRKCDGNCKNLINLISVMFTTFIIIGLSLTFCCARSERIPTIYAGKPTLTSDKKSSPDLSSTKIISPLANISQGFASIAECALPSVVDISTTQFIGPKTKSGQPRLPRGSPFDDLFQDFFEFPEFDVPRKVQSSGSGFIIRVTPDVVYVVTNNHVIADTKKIMIRLNDKTELTAVVHASDERTDIAILKIKRADLPVTKQNLRALEWGDSDMARVGDWVVSVGNPFGLSNSITAGIISSKGRDISDPISGNMRGYVDDFIQHSAQINMGNSGGCLLNMEGKVIGINTAIYSPTGGNVGVGFAVPSGVAKKTVDQLIDFGRTKRGWIGIRIQSLTPEMAEALGINEQGVIVGGTSHDGPAEKAGIQNGDIIIEYNGMLLDDKNRLTRLVGETEIGQTVPLKIWRKGNKISVKVTVGEYEEALRAGKIDESPVKKGPSTAATEILGITLGPITENAQNRLKLSPSMKGVLIINIEPGSAGEEGELVAGEIITEVNQHEVQKPEEVLELIAQAKKKGHKNVMLLVIGKHGPRYPSLRIDEE